VRGFFPGSLAGVCALPVFFGPAFLPRPSEGLAPTLFSGGDSSEKFSQVIFSPKMGDCNFLRTLKKFFSY